MDDENLDGEKEDAFTTDASTSASASATTSKEDEKQDDKSASNGRSSSSSQKKKRTKKKSTLKKQNKDGSSAPKDSTHYTRGKKEDPKEELPNRDRNTVDDAVPQPPRSNPAVQAMVDEILDHKDDYYQVLGVATTATDRQIQKAYRKRVQKVHPDKTGGDRRAFDKVAEAYEVLSDETKRQVYDRFGKAGVEAGVGGGGAASSYQDMFRSMFQQAQQQQSFRRQRQNQTLRFQLQVTLEDLYNGRTQNVRVTPPRHPHMGHGGSSSRSQKEVDVHIPRGSLSGQSIVLSGEADFHDDTTPGDVVFILTQVPHPTFTRKGHDLAMELTIGLDEAVSGVKRPIAHLDGTQIWIESAKTKRQNRSSGKFHDNDHHENHVDDSPFVPLVIHTGDVQVLKGRGMPKRNRPGEFGDLYIQYRVEMPEAKNGNALTLEEQQELSRLLTKLQGKNHLLHGGHHGPQHERKRNENTKEEDTYESHILQAAKPSDFGRASGSVVLEDEYDMGGIYEDHGDEFHPFASAASSFFHRQGGTGGTSRFYFGSSGSNPFDMGGNDDNDDGNVQCQQM